MPTHTPAFVNPSQITSNNKKYAGDPDSPNYEPPSPLIERPVISSEVDAALQKVCTHIVTEVKLNEEDLTKPQTKTSAQKKQQKHDKHSSFTFQKAKGYVPEVAATSFTKTTSRTRHSNKIEQQDKTFEPLEPTTIRVVNSKPADFASPDDEALWEIRNKLEARPKTSAAACVDYTGDETSGSSMQSAPTTAITSANMTPGHSSKRISQRADSQDMKATYSPGAEFPGVPFIVPGNGASIHDTSGRNEEDEPDLGKLLLSSDPLFRRAAIEKLSAPAEINYPRTLSINKSTPLLPSSDALLADSSNESGHNGALKKMSSLPQMTQKIHTNEKAPSQPTYTSYYGKSTVPSNSAAPSRPGTSQGKEDDEYRRGRSMSITNSIREYIKPGSTHESRAASTSRAPSVHSSRSISSLRGRRDMGSGSWQGLRKKISNMSMRTRSRSSSHSRPGYDDGDEYLIDAEKMDLNKNLPPLPGLDTYQARPKHIGELMRKAIPKNLRRDTANVVIDQHGNERTMTAQEQVQRRQDLARAVMEKMTTGSMGSGSSRPTSSNDKEQAVEELAAKVESKPDRESAEPRSSATKSSIDRRETTRPQNKSPQQPRIVGQISIVKRSTDTPPKTPAKSRRSTRQDASPSVTSTVPPQATKTKRHGKWTHLLGFGRGSKNNSKVVHVM
ncbi:MAG: hypothetical protein Q9160_006962 [Pyrenula sp. 1 TL-2023]